MSPSWRDHLQIVLCPDRVVLVRFARGLRRRVADKARIACEPPGARAPWRPALDALRECLQAERWRAPRATLILSNHFFRYLVVPWDRNLDDPEGQRAMMRYSFARIYGDAAKDWDYRWQAGRPPAPFVASAFDPALVAEAGDLLARAGIRLASVQPYLMAAFNTCRRRLPGSAWFIAAETGRVCLARFEGGEWRGLLTAHTGARWEEELPAILRRALMLGIGEAPGPLFLHAPETRAADLAPGAGWLPRLLPPRALPGFDPQIDAAYGMAAGV